jgi:light-regulated signal transduction histidine kinase (bacteriophytochrome)
VSDAAPGIGLRQREAGALTSAIQPHAALLAFEPTALRIVHAGGNTAALLGVPPAALLGETAAYLFLPDQVATLRGLLEPGRMPARPQLLFTTQPTPDAPQLDAVAYPSGELIALEIEARCEPEPEDPVALVQTMMRPVQLAASTQAVCEAIVIQLRAATGFDRVMMYRFLPDGSGAVIAEAAGDGIDSFLGLHYPESDLPKPAIVPHRPSMIRLIPDAAYTPAAILPDGGPPMDLGQSAIRSASPGHLRYLAKMGVAASLSRSIILHGQIWGLIACHHHTPRFLPHRLRAACDLFADTAAAQLDTKVATEDFGARLLATSVHEELVTRMSQANDLAEGLIWSHPNLLDFIPAGGVGLWVDGKFNSLGATPSCAEVQALTAWLNETAHDGVYQTDCLPLLYPPAEAYAGIASGILAVSLSRAPHDYVLWFRPEVVRTVTWAAKPQRPADSLVPTTHQRFAAWEESVRLHATPWRAVDLEAAQRLRLSLLEVVLRRMDQVARQREIARRRQEEVNRELDRRLEQAQVATRAYQEESERRAVVEAELSAVLRRTVEDQEAERARIARELHDTLGQSLTLLQLGLDGVSRTAPADGALQERVGTLKTLALDLGQQVHRLAWEIRPTVLDDLGLQNAIRNLLETWGERSRLSFDLHLTLADRRMKPAIESTLYRVLQEALTNVVRHAEATRVGVILGIKEDHATMIIEDDGRGFGCDDAPAQTTGGATTGHDHTATRHFGLLGMRERLALVHGSLEIESAPGRGTTLFVRVPL